MANNPTTKPNDVKREEFRKYVERAGVMDALTNVMVKLYMEREKPDDAIDYIRKHFVENESIEESSSEVDLLKKDLADARAEIATLKGKLIKYETGEDVE